MTETKTITEFARFEQGISCYSTRIMSMGRAEQAGKLEFSRLDKQRDRLYLDYTGNLYPASPDHEFSITFTGRSVRQSTLWNPTANLSSLVIEETRQRVLEYFNAEKDYCCIFTAKRNGQSETGWRIISIRGKKAHTYIPDKPQLCSWFTTICTQ